MSYMAEKILGDVELSNLSKDEFYLYVIIIMLKHHGIFQVSYNMIRKMLGKKLRNEQIDQLADKLVGKKILKLNEVQFQKRKTR